MKNFICLEGADIVQYISFPVEILGFIMTLIEVLRPRTADKIEGIIDILGENTLFEEYAAKLTQAVMNFILLVYIFVLLFKATYSFSRLSFFEGDIFQSTLMSLQSQIPLLKVLANENLMLYISIGVIVTQYKIFRVLFFTVDETLRFIAKILKRIIKFLNKTSNGRALGSLGLIISLIGVIGEFYQVMAIEKFFFAFVVSSFFVVVLIYISFISKRRAKNSI